jgi:hypothetical protein
MSAKLIEHGEDALFSSPSAAGLSGTFMLVTRLEVAPDGVVLVHIGELLQNCVMLSDDDTPHLCLYARHRTDIEKFPNWPNPEPDQKSLHTLLDEEPIYGGFRLLPHGRFQITKARVISFITNVLAVFGALVILAHIVH